jgi:hypothetical protein
MLTRSRLPVLSLRRKLSCKLERESTKSLENDDSVTGTEDRSSLLCRDSR